ncbi:hypothetical protein CONPUDRAFT_132470 [Coniophora puteana RWD-64-598 SS2]|uniref:PCI domain-containing protein n=1 Tax=Coniophora puteana (strain RWD-64-598) TaxID=741705 RepID=A0A5M3M7N2_CONPW|nr:uncharacterized protein CONPUDRAFT_132470 [Coniophora puteana RWD-64-598 SS2]EIW74854.1 hypothetical protein CONPUDRAFT_132470 [Coniophora puteana RWD-64-598 SS2]
MSTPTSMPTDQEAPPKLDLDAFITQALGGTPAPLHSYFESFRTLYNKRLWHQLTLKLFDFINEPASAPYQVEVFTRFVRDFESRINSLRLVELAAKVARQIDNPQSHLLLLSSLLTRIREAENPSKEAEAHLLTTIAYSKLVFGDLDGARKDMDSSWEILETLSGVERGVSGTFYQMAADYYKAKADYAPYYKNALLYLACIDVATDLTAEERLLRAHDLGIAALLGETIYNFGELLMHPILDALDNTDYDWIKRLLFTFNEGNIGKFEAIAPLFPKEPILQDSYPFLRQKICLMALIEVVFRRGAGERTIPFQTVAAETRLPTNEVEHLLMKALSLNLIKGSLDQVSGVAHITWVQPRVLSREQIGHLASRLQGWMDRLASVEGRIAPEVSATA